MDRVLVGCSPRRGAPAEVVARRARSHRVRGQIALTGCAAAAATNPRPITCADRATRDQVQPSREGPARGLSRGQSGWVMEKCSADSTGVAGKPEDLPRVLVGIPSRDADSRDTSCFQSVRTGKVRLWEPISRLPGNALTLDSRVPMRLRKPLGFRVWSKTRMALHHCRSRVDC